MPRRISSPNFLSKIKSQYLGNGYQLINSNESQEYLFSLSSVEQCHKSFNDYEKSEETQKLLNILDYPKEFSYCCVERIISENNEEIVYEIHNGFTSHELFLIKNALHILVNRLFKEEILQNMYNICGISNDCCTNQVWKQSNLTDNQIYYDKYLLLKYQLMCLKTSSLNGEFPLINIYSINNQTKILSPCIYCISHGSNFLIDGEFNIYLNQQIFSQSNDKNSNILNLSAIILYEMLFNLGHRSNNNQSQIDIFKNCFLYNGNFFL